MLLRSLVSMRCVLAVGLWLACCLPGDAWAREVRVAFGTMREPFVFAGKHRGIEVEIVRTVLQRLGYELVPVYVPNARIKYEFEQRLVDVATTAQPEPGAEGYFSEPYIAFENVAITLAARKISLNKLADLAGLRVVGFQKASQFLGEDYKQAVSRCADYRETADQMGQNRLLYRGGADVIVRERHIFEYQNKLLADSPFAEKPQPVEIRRLFPPTVYRLRFHDMALRDAFDLELAAITQLGIPAAIARKYGY